MRRTGWLLLVWVGAAACSGSITGGGGDRSEADDAAPGGGARDASVAGDAGQGARPGVGGASAGGAGGELPGVGPAAFACDADAQPESTRFRRLTERQYDNTLADLLRWGLGDDALADEVLEALESARARLPVDVRKTSSEDLHGSYRRLDQDVAQAHVDAWFELAVRAGRELSAPARLRELAGECAVDGDGSNEEGCVDDLLRGFGARALRRPLDADERAFYAGFYGDLSVEEPAGWADVIAGLLSAPQFLYLVEHGGDALDGVDDVYTLSAFELASRLSYHFWETLPDQALWDAAEDGSLLEPDAYTAQVERLFSDERTKTTTREFFRDWLKLDELPDLTQNLDSPLYQSFAGDDLPTDALREHMQDEVLDLLQYLTWDEPAGFGDLLSTEASFARTDDLADLYGIEAWDGSGAPPEFSPGERPGLFTRAAFLVTASANTRPIMKGLFIRRNVLCDTIPPPPNNAANKPPELSDTESTREVVEGLTEQPGTACAGCHATQINPLGFATEGFDALGRVRTEQLLYSDDGEQVGTAAIDTVSTPQVVSGDTAESSGPEDLMQLIRDSGKAHACFARHYFRFSFGRFEDLEQDGCALERLRSALVDTGTLSGMLREVALDPAFQQRNFAESTP